jgi:hypothetical protein
MRGTVHDDRRRDGLQSGTQAQAAGVFSHEFRDIIALGNHREMSGIEDAARVVGRCQVVAV